LAIFFLAHTAIYLGLGLPRAFPALSAHAASTGPGLLDPFAAGLLALIALWLVLGIYSRVMALTGMVICTAADLLFDGSILTPERIAAFVAVAVLAVVGGGRFRLHAGGWRLRGAF
jgi:hypothetical protein